MKSYDLRYMVQQYLNRNGKREARFRENLLGSDWFKTFMLRHPNSTMKLAENTKRVRAAVSYGIIESYFSELKDTLEDVSPSNIINYNETNSSDNPGSVEVVVKRVVKHAHRIIDTSKSSTSVMFAISGDDKLLPPYVVYEAKHLYPGWTEGGFPASRYNRTPSGWFDSCIFEDWFSTIVLPSMRNLDGPKVIIGKSIGAAALLPTLIESEPDELEYDNHSEQDIEMNDDEELNGISEENVSEGEKDNITEKENYVGTSMKFIEATDMGE
ncbi:hypothetical protein JTB14_002252 [Gonioctena quinquepunctata]|nr:hypothetical protein JTB14_002252 [Gonioctena quinquepunctata]